MLVESATRIKASVAAGPAALLFSESSSHSMSGKTGPLTLHERASDMRVHPEVVQQIWTKFRRVGVVLFASWCKNCQCGSSWLLQEEPANMYMCSMHKKAYTLNHIFPAAVESEKWAVENHLASTEHHFLSWFAKWLKCCQPGPGLTLKFWRAPYVPLVCSPLKRRQFCFLPNFAFCPHN